MQQGLLVNKTFGLAYSPFQFQVSPIFKGKKMELLSVFKDGQKAMIEPAQKEEFVANGWSEKETKAAEPKRARNADGTLKADDKSTKDVNEAWEGGVAPKATKKTKTT